MQIKCLTSSEKLYFSFCFVLFCFQVFLLIPLNFFEGLFVIWKGNIL